MNTYTNELESLLEELIEFFDFDPSIGYYTFETEDGPGAIMSDEFGDLLDRANDLVYGTDGDEIEDEI